MLERSWSCKHILALLIWCLHDLRIRPRLQAPNELSGASIMEEDPKPKSSRSSGGLARAKSLSPNERRSIARKAAIARWKTAEGEVPTAVNQGSLKIGDVELDCYVLADRRRLIHKRAMAKALGMKSEGGNVFTRAMSRKSLGSAVPEDLKQKLANPVVFNSTNGKETHGYEGTDLIDVCDAIWQAKKDGKLPASQEALGLQAEIIIRSAAKIGIVALIDEATGYFKDKRKDEYRVLFQQFIRNEFGQWELEFPSQFFDIWYRLYGIKRSPVSNRHPQFFGKLIRKYVYAPLANSNGAILELLDEKNPVVYANGGRRYKMTQFLNEHIGKPAFRSHLWQVIGIGNSSRSKEGFERGFRLAFPQTGLPETGDLFPEDD